MADYRKVIPLILSYEGGVSRNPNDSAARNPAPGTGGAHTNKGVTWTTFVGLAARLGYPATVALFLEMPPAVWGRIFKVGFWDALHLDGLKHQGVADVLVDFAWGAGPGAAAKGLQRALVAIGRSVAVDGNVGELTLKAANAATGARLLAAVNEEKRRYYFSQQQNSEFFAGWNRRLTELEAFARGETGKFALGAAAAAAALLGGAYYLYTRPASFYNFGKQLGRRRALSGTDWRPSTAASLPSPQKKRKQRVLR